MTAKIVDGRAIASEIKEDIKNKVKKISEKYDNTPKTVTIKIGDNAESDLYLRLRNKACAKVGIETEIIELKSDVSQEKVVKKIKQLNADKSVHGILIQFPLPDHISGDRLINALDPLKDIEGFHPINMGNTLLGQETIIPCTPLAVLKIIEHEKTKLKGADVTIVNHSNIVGKPLTALLLNRNATVSVTHVFTKDFSEYTKNADILISAAGVQKLIKKDHVKKDSFVIDVGIINTDEGITGDVDFEEVSKIAGKITPVPGGVGPVTVACSLHNMIKTFENCMNK